MVNLAVIFIAALVLCTSIATIVMLPFHISTPDKICENMRHNSVVLDINGTTPCRPIADEGPP
jgi:hypothetical protein